jgi:glycosyltransferase involved in cell wall biosynthesis
MSVHNGERYLRECIESILAQTYTDFEFLVIDDSSRDGTTKIIESFYDQRIQLIRNEEKMGLTRSLNKGLKFSRGRYLARIDADDVSLPHRLETQVRTLTADPSLSMCASLFRVIDERGVIRGGIHPNITGDMMVTWRLLFANVIAHSSVMMRKDVVEEMGGYAEWAARSQDYELWERMSRKHKIYIIPEVLTYWRDHDCCITRKHSDEQCRIALEVVHRALNRIIDSPVPREYSAYLHDLYSKRFYISSSTVPALKLLSNVKESFLIKHRAQMDTQKEIDLSIQNIHSNLMKKATRKFSICSFRVMLYILLRDPYSGLRTLIWYGQRAVDKALHPQRESKRSVTSCEKTK